MAFNATNPYQQNYAAYPMQQSFQQPNYTQQYFPQQTQGGFACRPVTSKEEALAAQTDFMAAGTVMPDLGHGMIYLKRFNPNTGLSDWAEFALVSDAAAPPNDYGNILRGFGEQLNGLTTRFDELSEKLEQWRPKAKKGSDAE